eukprot:3941571-Rhodomonas_salina.4
MEMAYDAMRWCGTEINGVVLRWRARMVLCNASTEMAYDAMDWCGTELAYGAMQWCGTETAYGVYSSIKPTPIRSLIEEGQHMRLSDARYCDSACCSLLLAYARARRCPVLTSDNVRQVKEVTSLEWYGLLCAVDRDNYAG